MWARESTFVVGWGWQFLGSTRREICLGSFGLPEREGERGVCFLYVNKKRCICLLCMRMCKYYSISQASEDNIDYRHEMQILIKL